MPCKRGWRWRFHPLPASLRTGKRVVLATGGARSARGRGKVSSESNPVGESRGTVFSAPVPVQLRRLSRSKGNFQPAGDGRPNHSPVVWGVPSGPWSCSWRQSTCRSRGSACGLEGAREKRREQGSSRGFNTSMNSCGSPVRRPADGAAPRGSPKGSPRRPRTTEDTSDLELGATDRASASFAPNPGSLKPAALTCPRWKRNQLSGRRDLRKRSSPRAVKRGVRGFDSTEAPSADKAWAPPLPRDERGTSGSPCRKVGVDGPEAGSSAVKRAAVGGRMTARWCGAAGRHEAQAEGPKRGLDVERRRVSHGARRAVSERDVFSGARDVKRRL